MFLECYNSIGTFYCDFYSFYDHLKNYEFDVLSFHIQNEI